MKWISPAIKTLFIIWIVIPLLLFIGFAVIEQIRIPEIYGKGMHFVRSYEHPFVCMHVNASDEYCSFTELVKLKYFHLTEVPKLLFYFLRTPLIIVSTVILISVYGIKVLKEKEKEKQKHTNIDVH